MRVSALYTWFSAITGGGSGLNGIDEYLCKGSFRKTSLSCSFGLKLWLTRRFNDSSTFGYGNPIINAAADCYPPSFSVHFNLP
jgi:hypothetical protein